MRTQTRGRYWLIRPHLWLVAITVAAAAPGLVVNMIDSHHRDADLRLMPELMWIAGASAFALFGSVLAAIGVLVWKGRARMAGRTTLFKILYATLAVATQLVVATALAAALVFSNFHLFDGNYLGVKARSPAGDRTAYLYSDGFFCGYKVFVRRDGETRLTEHHSFNTSCDDRPAEPRLVWSADGTSVSVTGPDGRPVPSKTVEFFSPHH